MANINKNIIMQAGAAVANAANKAAGLTAATPEPGAIISAVQLVNGGRTIGPDALAHFTESVRNKLLSLLVTMEPIQDFNGYGHPWPAGGGKNLFDCDTTIQAFIDAAGIENPSPNNGASDYILLKPNTDYCVSCNRTMFNIGICIFDDTKTSVLSRLDHNNVQSVVISSSADTRYLRTWINVNNSTAMTVDTCKTYEPQVEAGTTRTSFAPYANICPISGRTGLHVYAGPTTAQADATTYAVEWTTEAGTVYGGTLDVVSGVLTVDRAMVDLGTLNWSASSGAWLTTVPEKANGSYNIISSAYTKATQPYVANMNNGEMVGSPTNNYMWVKDTAYEAASDFKAGVSGVQLCYELATPLTHQLTTQDIITLVGDNYIWSDSGNVTITE